MPALTLRQPWAFCITHGTKRIENRGWKPPQWLTEVAIHAGARSGWDPAADGHPLVLAALRDYRDKLDSLGTRAARTVGDLIDFGAVVAVAEVRGSHWPLSPIRAFSRDGRPCAPGAQCSPWAVDTEVHWELGNVRMLPRPVPCRGAQRIWYLPPDVDSAVRAQLTDKETAK
jgi:hypothetical protein